MRNAVFFSRYSKDPHSPKLLSLIRGMPFAKEFLYICVDPDPVTKKKNEELLAVLEITRVPTILVNGQNLVGDEAKAWVYEMYRRLQQGDDEEDYQYQTSPQYQENFQDQYEPSSRAPLQGFRQEPPPHGSGMRQMPGMGHMHQGPPDMYGDEQPLELNGPTDSNYADPFSSVSLSGAPPGRMDGNFLKPVMTKIDSDVNGQEMSKIVERCAMDRVRQVPQAPEKINGLPGQQQQQNPYQMRR